MPEEPINHENPAPAATDGRLPISDTPPDNAPSAELMDGPVSDQPVDGEPTPVDAPADRPTDEPIVEPPFVADLRAQIKAQAEELATLKGKPTAPAAQAAPYEPTPQQWDMIEKDFGFTVQEVKAEDGSVTKSLNVNPRQLVKTIFAQLQNAAAQLRQEFDGRLQENTADSRMDRAFYDMEKRAANPLTDIRQHQKEIKEYLSKFYNKEPQKWSDPEILEAAYFNAVGVKSRQKPASPNKSDMRVIHPAAGKPAPKPVGNGGISPQEREMMRGMISPKTGKQITDAEWLAAKGNGR